MVDEHSEKVSPAVPQKIAVVRKYAYADDFVIMKICIDDDANFLIIC